MKATVQTSRNILCCAMFWRSHKNAAPGHTCSSPTVPTIPYLL